MKQARRWTFLAGYIVALFAFLLFAAFLDLGLTSFLLALVKLPIWIIGLSVLLFGLHAFINAYSFGFLVQSFATDTSIPKISGIWLSTVLAKYIPGGVWHPVSRGIALSRSGVDTPTIIITSLMEQIVSLAVTVILALALLSVIDLTILFLTIIFGSIVVLIYFSRWIARKKHHVKKPQMLAFACLGYSIAMLPYAAAYLVITDPDSIRIFLGWLFAATSGGMAALITPSGLGVREVILSGPFDREVGQSIFIAAIVARGAIFLSEIIITGLALLFVPCSVRKTSKIHLPPTLRSLGYGASGPGYPNAAAVEDMLTTHFNLHFQPSIRWLRHDVQLWRLLQSPRIRELIALTELMFGNAIQLAMCVKNRARLYYCPYPAPFVLWWASWLPHRFKPNIIADSYISLWESAFPGRDRKAKNSLLATLLQKFEGRALRAARHVIVDTKANKFWMAKTFDIDVSRIHTFPLAFDATPFKAISPVAAAPARENLKVLFFGTFIPLHGIDVILHAIEILKSNEMITFDLIGDGHDSWKVDQFLRSHPECSVNWHREWINSETLSSLLAQSDLVLGVFGGKGKASRVLPWKAYISMAAARPVLTQDSFSLPDGTPDPPFFLTKPNGHRLAKRLLEISSSREQLEIKANASREYFDTWLSENRILNCWNELLSSESVALNRK